MRSLEDRIAIERVARALAASAGLIWDHMEKYPGYARGIWLNKARLLLTQVGQEERGVA
jgi:hypothetical protein